MGLRARIKPITVGSHLFGLFAGTLTWIVLWFVDAVGKGNPDAGFILIATPIVLLQNFAFGLLPFVALRNAAPSEGAYRFVFFMAVLAPAVYLLCLAGGLWIDGFSDYSPYFHSPKPPLVDRFGKTLYENWPTIFTVTILGGLACWGFDRKSLLISEIPRLRMRARYLLAGSLSVPIVVGMIILTCNQYVVLYRAQKAADDRPYCILVPSAGARYKIVTRRSQLSIANMQANYTLTTGSMGGFYATNHALLVLDNPREYLNWSYRAENFVREPMINAFVKFDSCTPRRDFVGALD